jgi:hypothetical protein
MTLTLPVKHDPELEKIKDIPFVFIVGRGRSGTSLLQDMLGANPVLSAAKESPFILALLKKYEPVKVWTPQLIEAFLDDLYQDLQFRFFWNVRRQELRADILRYSLSELTFQVICKIVYLNFPGARKKEETRWIVDKNPLYSLYLNDLEPVFPKSRFIHIIRDYRDNIISCRNSFGEKDLGMLANRWVNYHRKIDAFDRAHKDKVFCLKYEDLVSRPKEMMEAICDFLGVPYSESMLRFYETNKRVDPEVENVDGYNLPRKMHLNLRSPVNTSAVNRWTKELGGKELELIDHIAGSYAAYKGYEPTTHVNRWNYGWIRAKKQFQFRLTFGLTRMYYLMPSFMRRMMQKISTLLYRKAGYASRLNRLRLIRKNQLRSKEKAR